MTEQSLSRLQDLSQPPEIVTFFNGLFRRVGVVIDDRKEMFSARHDGASIAFEDGVDEASVDFVVHIVGEQMDRLLGEVADGHLSKAEEYRVVRTLFTPATQAMLRNPVMSSRILRSFIGVEDLAHVKLRSPVEDEPDVAHTLIHAAGQWIVVPGLHGTARRVFDLTTDDALEYQRHAMTAMQENSWRGWLAFGTWYKRWRETVSRKV